MINDQIFNILLVEGNIAEAILLQGLLAEVTAPKSRLVCVQNLPDALQKLAIDNFEIILLDLNLPNSECLKSLEVLINVAPQSAIVVLADAKEKNFALETLRQGAEDYLVKQLLDVELLTRSLDIALRHKQTQLELAAAKQEGERLKEELQSTQAELEHFVYVVSHDLKQPLANIFSWTQMLRRRYQEQLGDKGQQYIQMIIAGSKQMEQFLDAILDYSRIARQQNKFQETDCHKVLSRALARLEREIDRSNAIITHDDLPIAIADPAQLSQLFERLIDNAIKYRREEPVKIHISATLNKQESTTASEWIFSIGDNGIGIESQYFDRIFKIFQRLHSITEYPGTGIGLAICEKIVKRHGGKIWVKSQSGVGSTFFFSLPAVIAVEA